MKHKHHIIPKHMGGTNDPSNLIELTVEEHAEAHKLLWEQHGNWQDNVAWKALSGHIGKEEIIHEIHKNMNKGRVPSIETREKMAAAKRGKKLTPEHSKALHEGRKKSKNSDEHIKRLSEANKGKKLTDEHKKIMSEKRKNHPKKLEWAKEGGKISMEKYKNDPERQKAFSESMKLSWKKRKEMAVL
jgi:hypothetical protein